MSLDKDQKKWVHAIEADGLTWNHVSDLKGWDCEPAALYGASSIPHAVLVDPDGIIVAKDLRGDDLRNTLAELIDG